MSKYIVEIIHDPVFAILMIAGLWGCAIISHFRWMKSVNNFIKTLEVRIEVLEKGRSNIGLGSSQVVKTGTASRGKPYS